MANIITAGNGTNGGTQIVTDTSGTLDIKTGSGSGAIAISVNGSQATTFAAGVSGTTGSFSGDMSFNSGYGSAAVAYGCRAWVNFNGTGTIAIRSSGNVTSITDGGVGVYTVNFTTAMPDANYATNALVSSDATALTIVYLNGTSSVATTSSVALQVATIAGAAADRTYVAVSIFR
jgi:hypothetical protein